MNTSADQISAVSEMQQLVKDAFQSWNMRPDSLAHRLVRLEVPVSDLDAYHWLAVQQCTSRVLWKGRDEDRVCAGVGMADLVCSDHPGAYEDVLQRCRRFTKDHPGIRYFGGFTFTQHTADDPSWTHFGAARFVLPRFELVNSPDASFLACNLLFRNDSALELSSVLDLLNRLVFQLTDALPRLPGITSNNNYQDQEGWEGMVLSAMQMLEGDVLEKIVLARRAVFQFNAEMDACVLIARLHGLTSNCYHFCFQPDHETAFMGTTPERLFRRTGRELVSEVLAGTRPRDRDPEQDAQLARELLASDKDQREHDIVRKSIRQQLHLVSQQVQVEDTARLLKLERKQHLYSAVQAGLRDEVTDAQLLELLHPTPAVGGYPRENALSEISRLEPFLRGWYAAPVGWVARDTSEFAVGIRSCLVEGERVSVYSGAGIVTGSDPLEEWNEIENKIVDFVKVTSL